MKLPLGNQKLWEICKRCWVFEPSERITLEEILIRLDELTEVGVISLKATWAHHLRELLQDYSPLDMTPHVVKRSERYVAAGRYSDVYCSYLRDWKYSSVKRTAMQLLNEEKSVRSLLTPAQVAVKVLRLSGPVSPAVEKVCCLLFGAISTLNAYAYRL